MRLVAFTVALLGSHVLRAASSNLRMSNPPVTPAKAEDHDLVKLQTIEHSLQSLTKQPHAPNGTQDLLNLLSKAETDLKAAGTAKEARAAVMKRVNTAMSAFQAQLMQRSLALKKAASADDAKFVERLQPIAKRLQDRLDKITKLEKDVKARMATSAKEQATMQKAKLSRVKPQSKDDLKTEKLLKFFAKKNKRESLKKLASWAVEKKALTDAVRLAKKGDAEGTRSAMEKVMHAEKGSQDFLY